MDIPRTTAFAALPLAFFTASFTGCGGESPDPAGSEVTDSAGVRIVDTRIGETAARCAVSEVFRIGSLEDDAEGALFAVNDAVQLDDGRIVVVNRGTAELKIFSPEGELVGRFGREGDGPGEFRNLWSVDLRAGDTLVVGDYRPWRFSFFTPEGEFLRSVQLQPDMIERPDFALALPSGHGFVVEDPAWETQDEFTDRVVPLWRYGEDGVLADTVGLFWMDRYGYLSQEIGYVGNPIFGARARFAHLRDDLVVYGAGRHEQLEIWTTGGELRTLVRWTARDRGVTPDETERWRTRRIRQVRSRAPEMTPMQEQVLEAQTGEHLPVADRFPGHAGLVVSQSGPVWVEEYRRPSDQGPNRWFVFEEDGHLRCVATLPDDLLGLLNVRGDRLLALHRDELDVEYVVALQVEGPGSGPGS